MQIVEGAGVYEKVGGVEAEDAAGDVQRVVAALHVDGAAVRSGDGAVVGDDVVALARLDGRAVALDEAGRAGAGVGDAVEGAGGVRVGGATLDGDRPGGVGDAAAADDGAVVGDGVVVAGVAELILEADGVAVQALDGASHIVGDRGGRDTAAAEAGVVVDDDADACALDQAGVVDDSAADRDAVGGVGAAAAVEAVGAGALDLAAGVVVNRARAVDVHAVTIAVLGEAGGANAVNDVADTGEVAADDAVVVNGDVGDGGAGGVGAEARAVAADDDASGLVGDDDVGGAGIGLGAVAAAGDEAGVGEGGVVTVLEGDAVVRGEGRGDAVVGRGVEDVVGGVVVDHTVGSDRAVVGHRHVTAEADGVVAVGADQAVVDDNAADGAGEVEGLAGGDGGDGRGQDIGAGVDRAVVGDVERAVTGLDGIVAEGLDEAGAADGDVEGHVAVGPADAAAGGGVGNERAVDSQRERAGGAAKGDGLAAAGESASVTKIQDVAAARSGRRKGAAGGACRNCRLGGGDDGKKREGDGCDEDGAVVHVPTFLPGTRADWLRDNGNIPAADFRRFCVSRRHRGRTHQSGIFSPSFFPVF